MDTPRIGIVGAGPGGLTLARVLRLYGIDAHVFEREAAASARPQGGSLDMHADSGQFAIQCCGLRNEFKRIARYEDQETRVYDKYGELRFLEDDVEGKDRPEVDRGHLRAMLLDSLPDGMVEWNRELNAAVALEDGDVELQFKDGLTERFDLVVGADGAWSRIRPLVSEARPIYSGMVFVELGIDDVDRRFPEVARLVGRGLMFAVGDSKAIIGHRDANAHIGIYAALRADEGFMESDAVDRSSSEAMRRSLAAQFIGWSDALLELIYRCGERMVPRAIYALPVGHRWKHRAGVTLIGDAAHLMSPFGGDGANLAMWDGADLGLALGLALARGGDWRTAVREFEAVIFARAEEAAAGAWGAIQEVFAEGGLEHMVAAMEGSGLELDWISDRAWGSCSRIG